MEDEISFFKNIINWNTVDINKLLLKKFQNMMNILILIM